MLLSGCLPGGRSGFEGSSISGFRDENHQISAYWCVSKDVYQRYKLAHASISKFITEVKKKEHVRAPSSLVC